MRSTSKKANHVKQEFDRLIGEAVAIEALEQLAATDPLDDIPELDLAHMVEQWSLDVDAWLASMSDEPEESSRQAKKSWAAKGSAGTAARHARPAVVRRTTVIRRSLKRRSPTS